ncbi:Shikimate kinase [Butyrivibrio fibrisolvens 16/4]|nr:Shikimate kinase [Butyrivibrio fibrisolvens 16/4]
MSNIFLIGFMGTGKSTIAEALKRKYDMQIVDMDAEIEKEQKMVISDIFATKGEEYFRDLETQLIKDLQKKITLLSLVEAVLFLEMRMLLR